MEENDVLRYFIEGGPLKGIWFTEVPVGLEVITKLAVKEKVSWKGV
jgi:hypothetical protein